MTDLAGSISRPTEARIDLANLRFNLRSSREFIGPDLKYMAVVKADAYGHGAVACSRALADEGVDWLGVALVEEGLELRAAGLGLPILILGGFWPGQESILVSHRLTPVVFRIDQARTLNAEAMRRGMSVPIHVKIDTGMGRLGVRYEDTDSFARELSEFKNLAVEGLMTHFAAADDLSENEFTALQTVRFYDVVNTFRDRGFEPEIVDLANSPGSVVHPIARGTMVRLGGILYGLGDDVLPKGVPLPKLRPVLSLVSKISCCRKVPKGETVGYGRTFRTERDSIIASIPIGYDDGYRRNLSNNASVIIRNQLAPVVGRVSMDWITVDVTDVPNVREGDEVILIGRSATHQITAAELASRIGSLSYEITCGIGKRVPRVFSE